MMVNGYFIFSFLIAIKFRIYKKKIAKAFKISLFQSTLHLLLFESQIMRYICQHCFVFHSKLVFFSIQRVERKKSSSQMHTHSAQSKESMKSKIDSRLLLLLPQLMTFHENRLNLIFSSQISINATQNHAPINSSALNECILLKNEINCMK